ncbi:MAG: GNAT family N-acetyltransferase [Deltaproteobacteria bacterium]|nr:GNAT family N-acetyltransferase [Deltaproteobacteria bacterium]MBN2671121.1 GNAT family N-acetyltransferase [Deltaproteobacteria bacterium]
MQQICLRTAASGTDATTLFFNSSIPAELFAFPYLSYDASLCLVACLDNIPHGYILGTADSEKFIEWMEHKWLPRLRSIFPADTVSCSPVERSFLNLIHTPAPSWFNSPPCPAHLHIDLLPAVQRQRVGSKLVNQFIKLLQQQNISQVYVDVSPRNRGAKQFYTALGFTTLPATNPSSVMIKNFS